MHERVAIVGGGWAGIACAVELADHGTPVTLYEAARQLGGRARSVDWEGLAIDNGQHLMIGAYRETRRLLRRLGTGAMLEQRPLTLIMPGFRLQLPQLPKPFHLGFGLLNARGLSLREKLAAIRFMRHLQAIEFRLPVDLPVDALLAEQRQPDNLIEKLWAPLCIAALNTPTAHASAQVFCNVLHDSLAGTRSDSDLLLNRADLSKLVPNAALRFLERHRSNVRLASKVDSVSRLERGFLLDGPDTHADRVILATHPARLPHLLTGLPEMTRTLSQIGLYTWQPILTLWLRFERALPFRFPMIGLGDHHAPWAFERYDIAPGMVSLVMSAQGPHLDWPQEKLLEEYLILLARVFGDLPRLLAWKVIIEKRATYTCAPDLCRPTNITPINGLYLAGDFTAGSTSTNTYPATLEGAIRSGVECARLIIAEQK